MLLKSDFLSRVMARLGMATPSTSISDLYFDRMVISHERMDTSIPAGAVVFIGDSITQGLCVDAVTTPAVNYGICGDCTGGVLVRLQKYASLKRASAVVIAIGINDLAQGSSDDEILRNYRKILLSIPSGVAVVASAVLPIDSTLRPELYGKITHRRIANLNIRLKAECAKRTRCLFVDIGAVLQEQTGALRSAFHTGDGVHLSSEGYAVWIEELRLGLKNVQLTMAPAS
jgi:lysophospholipase L1-like esterase